MRNLVVVECLVVAVGISLSLLACDDRDSVVGADNDGDQPVEEVDQPVEDEEQRTEEGDRTRLMEMRQEIDALIGDATGSSIADCRYAGIGAKPCGGPWEYIVYSVSSTDSTALAERLAAYDAFEAEMNELYGYLSDCSVPNIPVLVFEGGRCGAR